MTAIASEFRVEPGSERHIPQILELIKGLAQYEKLSDEVTATEEDLRESLFGRGATAEAILAYAGTDCVGFAVFFSNYSTFLGRPGIYVEDLFVLPEWRGRGFGRRLLAHIAHLAVERRCGRLEWSVLDWNEPAIRFYETLGARPLSEWTMYRLAGPALEQLASLEDSSMNAETGRRG